MRNPNLTESSLSRKNPRVLGVSARLIIVRSGDRASPPLHIGSPRCSRRVARNGGVFRGLEPCRFSLGLDRRPPALSINLWSAFGGRGGQISLVPPWDYPRTHKSPRRVRRLAGACRVWCMSDAKNLMVRCPTTGKVADTGFTMDAETLEAATLEGNAFECGHCFEFHAWTKADLLQDA